MQEGSGWQHMWLHYIWQMHIISHAFEQATCQSHILHFIVSFAIEHKHTSLKFPTNFCTCRNCIHHQLHIFSSLSSLVQVFHSLVSFSTRNIPTSFWYVLKLHWSIWRLLGASLLLPTILSHHPPLINYVYTCLVVHLGILLFHFWSRKPSL
jgi:hypothetical protein